MNTDDFHYSLPEALIAQHPPAQRAQSRLLVLERGSEYNYQQLQFSEFHTLCNENDLLVVNDTRVIPARIILEKPTGGRVEVMLERFTSESSLIALSRSNKPLRSRVELHLNKAPVMRYIGKCGDFSEFEMMGEWGADLFREHGQIPLPPYIHRSVESADVDRYQTVYAKNEGAVAAPTAGLHFDHAQFDALCEKGVGVANITLHVGAGTFKPVVVEEVTLHKMHKERIEVSQLLVDKIVATKANGGRIIAVGTTTVRALESAAKSGVLRACAGGTDLFIYPGFKFEVVDALVTNFHLPKSTLLMMTSAFVGKDKLFNAYEFAIENQYRFFSYGDAMFVQKKLEYEI